MFDTVIIGSGPAGLSAAVYASRAGLDLTVVERNAVSGGQVLNTYEVDNYLGMLGIGGFDMGMKFREHADKLGVSFTDGDASSIEKTDGGFRVLIDGGEALETKTVIIAAGASHSKLGVPGEDRLSGRGVSYCATCDGNFFKNKRAVVVGGGDVAVEDAIYLSRICTEVTLIHRRDELRATQVLQDELFGIENIKVRWNSVVDEIRGENTVTSALLRDVKTGETAELETDAVFVAVGIRPDTDIAEGLVERDKGGYILAGEDCAASLPGIFAAGDARKKKLRQIVTAVADGANAATSAQDFIKSNK